MLIKINIKHFIHIEKYDKIKEKNEVINFFHIYNKKNK